MPNDNFNRYCEELLAKYARRNQQAVARHLESLCEILRQEGNHVVQTMFGGSVRRNTYVNGLSDVDVLLIVNQSSLANQPPARVIEYVRDTIQRRLNQNPVTAGNLAVTVGYSGGVEIQILPAIRTSSGGIRIAEPGSTQWSNVSHPEGFAKKLSEVNHARNGRVVPVIKLAKAMADCFITRQDWKISGYHLESLAIDAFRNYQSAQDPKSMLTRLLTHSITAVMQPITNTTGQSRYVDEYLGPADAKARRRASTHFGQMRGMVNSCTTRAEFNALFCEGN
ncbi:MAG: nucleotidyltransferase [Chloroflexi bacterium]|nr:nucleotidyltransferase [Chloroflexota bacterium]MYD49660.1 nucleotidyltransferase [Chloroflexota bacterium]